MATCSFMGLPWYVAATVISIAHIDSLKMESESSAPGEQPQFLGVRLVQCILKMMKHFQAVSDKGNVSPGVFDYCPTCREQRITGILVFALTGVSIFLAPILKVYCGIIICCVVYYIHVLTSNIISLQFIPMPVLYGVFLYMGVASLSGIQVCH